MGKKDVVEILKNGKSVQIHPMGNSMMPFIYPGRDEVVISPMYKELRKYDIILFRSKETGVLTLHRIVDIDGKMYYVCGDNQYRLEPVDKEQVLGVVTEIIRKGKRINTEAPVYRSLAKLYTKNKHTFNVLRKLRNRSQ
ncbi:MAG: hypothetical protein E7185_00320 [Erysipelotrichaceae bacterium]|nr:hypothetical protein [Erysipelotrichaceae bacterium]